MRMAKKGTKKVAEEPQYTEEEWAAWNARWQAGADDERAEQVAATGEGVESGTEASTVSPTSSLPDDVAAAALDEAEVWPSGPRPRRSTLAQAMALQVILPFGRHQGKTLEQVRATSFGYCNWLVDAVRALHPPCSICPCLLPPRSPLDRSTARRRSARTRSNSRRWQRH